MLKKIPFMVLFLTRRCNLNCAYCGMNKNHMFYPDMKYFAKAEKPLEWWVNFAEKWYEAHPETFFVIMGGEPLILPWFPKFIEELNRIGTLYTFITNCTKQDELKNLLEHTPIIRGFTASCDVTDGEEDSDRSKKSSLGFDTLVWVKEQLGDKVDCCAEVTLNRYNINGALPLVRRLAEYEIFSSVSVIDPKLNDYYDFSNVEYNERDFVQKDEITKEIFSQLEKEKFVHMPHIFKYMYEALPYDLPEIEDLLGYPSIDADGRWRYSIRIRGIEVPRYVTTDMFIKAKTDEKAYEILKDHFMKDFTRYEMGLNWSGLYMAHSVRMGDHDTDDIIHGLDTKDLIVY